MYSYAIKVKILTLASDEVPRPFQDVTHRLITANETSEGSAQTARPND
jgi:hypothetical protein